MELELLKLLVDTSLFILIWMVQLLIYPSFLYFKEIDIKKWHKRYTGRIIIIVLPLMLGQLLHYSRSVFLDFSTYNVAMLAAVLGTWGITFFVSVPLHQDLDHLKDSLASRLKLVKTNWIRTALWTVILIINIINYGK
jgi:hypothetical protein